MKYPESLNSIRDQSFYAWQPSTWPEPPESFNEEFRTTLRTIFKDSLLDEIEHVITDAPTLEHRGHVIALSILCAIDAVSAYAVKTNKVGRRYEKYIEEFFPREYQPFAKRIYKLYRNSITHSWNLFEPTMWLDNREIAEIDGTINLGLRHFFAAFKASVVTLLERLPSDQTLQSAALHRYRGLKQTARL